MSFGDGAVIAFGIYLAAACLWILFGVGRHQWFFGDEWSFLAERTASHITDLFRGHGEHWSTIPILIYRALFATVGLASYTPYLAVLVVAHLGTAVLLRVVMRNAGVQAWTATCAASVLVLLGGGQENILRAFQMTLVGGLAFGLVHLVLADHDGALDRRDVWGLLAGIASLMCSGVGLVMAGVIGTAVTARRGIRCAAFHAVPLIGLYGAWQVLAAPEGISNPFNRPPSPQELLTFVWSGCRAVFGALGFFQPAAILFAALLVFGFPLRVWRSTSTERRGLASAIALLAGGVLFLSGSAYNRWFVTPVVDDQGRYVYLLVAFVLPALALAADEMGRRLPYGKVIAAGVFLIPIVANARFGRDVLFSADAQQQQRELILALAYSPQAETVPPYVRPNPWLTIGWLRDTAVEHGLPRPAHVSSRTARQIPLLLGLAQRQGPLQAADCNLVPAGTILRPERGERFGFSFDAPPPSGTNWLVGNTLAVALLSEGGAPLARTAFKPEFGEVLEVTLDGLVLRLNALEPSQRVILCRAGDSRPQE